MIVNKKNRHTKKLFLNVPQLKDNIKKSHIRKKTKRLLFFLFYITPWRN